LVPGVDWTNCIPSSAFPFACGLSIGDGKQTAMRDRTRIFCVVAALGASVPCLAQTPEPFEVRRAEAVFEELPVLNASEILRPEFLSGPHYKVREPVPTYFGANQFTIDSEFGVFEADGNEMLVTRIKEVNAIARLKEVSRTDEFKNA